MKKFNFLVLFIVLSAVFILSCSGVDSLNLTKPGAGEGEWSFFDDFEGANLWSTDNDGPNRWTVGTATYYEGVWSAYISNNGSSYAYSNSDPSASTLYRTVTFPFSITDFTLSFRWKGYAEEEYDYMTVYLVPSKLPVTSEEPLDSYRIGKTGGYHSSSGWTLETINLPVSKYSEQSYKLVFRWVNDNAIGVSPVAIDNVQITM